MDLKPGATYKFELTTRAGEAFAEANDITATIPSNFAAPANFRCYKEDPTKLEVYRDSGNGPATVCLYWDGPKDERIEGLVLTFTFTKEGEEEPAQTCCHMTTPW